MVKDENCKKTALMGIETFGRSQGRILWQQRSHSSPAERERSIIVGRVKNQMISDSESVQSFESTLIMHARRVKHGDIISMCNCQPHKFGFLLNEMQRYTLHRLLTPMRYLVKTAVYCWWLPNFSFQFNTWAFWMDLGALGAMST